MSDMALSLVIRAQDRASGPLKVARRSVTRFGRSSQRALSMISRAAGPAGRALDRLGNRYAALATGVVGAGTGRYVMQLGQRFTRLGIQARATAGTMEALKRQIFEVSRAPDIRIDPAELTSAVEKIVEKTGDLEFARANLRNIALAIQAAGAGGADIGGLVAEFQKLGIEGEKGVLMALDTLVSQGKAGAFTLQNLSTQGERAVAAFAAMGYQGQDAVQSMGALLQVARMGTGSAEMATTAFENLLKGIITKAKKLHGIRGVQVFDPAKLREGVEEFRPLPLILKDIIRASGGAATKLNRVFDAEAIRAINAAAAEFQKTGGFATLDKFLTIKGNGSEMLADSARAAKDASAALGNLHTAWKRLSDETLSGPIQKLADTLNGISPEAAEKAMKAAAVGAGVLGAAVAGRRVYQFGAGAARFMGLGRKGKGAMAAAGQLAGAAGGPIPVTVVNWPGSMGAMGGEGGGKGRKAEAGKAAKSAARFGARGRQLLGIAGKTAWPLMAIANGWNMYDAAKSGDSEQMGGAVGGFGGGLAGAAAGAAVGSVVPVIGTAIGTIVGGILGSLGGEGIGGWIARQFEDADKARAGADREHQAARAKQDIGKGSVVVRFENPPPGLQVREVRADGMFDVDVDAGPVMVGG